MLFLTNNILDVIVLLQKRTSFVNRVFPAIKLTFLSINSCFYQNHSLSKVCTKIDMSHRNKTENATMTEERVESVKNTLTEELFIV